MGDKLTRYSISLIDSLPKELYVILLVIFFVGAIVVIGIKRARNGWKYVTGLLLIEYIYILYASTVFFRCPTTERNYNYTPFWSYIEIANGNKTGLLSEDIMNIFVFLPVGFLLGILMSSRKVCNKESKVDCCNGWLAAIMVGAGISVGIEILQFVFKKGFSEVDDVMHNSLGCMIGYGICCCITKICKMVIG